MSDKIQESLQEEKKITVDQLSEEELTKLLSNAELTYDGKSVTDEQMEALLHLLKDINDSKKQVT